ncbi:glycosyltransferase family 39 protein [Acidobacteria bacterium AH-259-D05]|nr:glycosyltransferase family 39 protein [Acidobacteria bacterium AH-259-D05]
MNKDLVSAPTETPGGEHPLLAQIEQVICWSFVTLFVVLQIYCGVWLVSDFNWIYFIDHDDAYNVEQFLGNMQEDSVEALQDLRVTYGSELFLLIPVYQLITSVLGETAGLDAYRFLKILSIIAAGLSLILLRAIMRQSGSPVLTPALIIALIVTSPLFFTNALILKPDANIVLFLLTVGLWTLLKFDDSGKKGWLVISIALGALAAAVKWWGVFLLAPQLYLVALRDKSREPFKPLMGQRSLVVVNLISCVLLSTTVVLQGRLMVQQFPHLMSKVVAVAIGAIALLLAGFVMITGGSSLLLRHTGGNPILSSSMGVRFIRLSHHFLSAGCLFAAGYVVFAAPFLLSDQLRPSISYFSKYLLVRTSSSQTGGSLLNHLLANVAGWFGSIGQSGLLPWLLMPALVGSIIFVLRGSSDQEHWRRLRVIAFFTVSIMVFLIVLVTKKNAATQAMVFPFVMTLALTPAAIWATAQPRGRRNLVLTTLVLLATSQTVLQVSQMLGVISSYPKAIETIHSVNHVLTETIKEVSASDGRVTVFLLEREFPINSGVNEARQLTSTEYEEQLNQLASLCDGLQSGGQLGNSIKSQIFMVMAKEPLVDFPGKLDRLTNRGCLELVSEIDGDSSKRGGGGGRFSYGIYRIQGP